MTADGGHLNWSVNTCSSFVHEHPRDAKQSIVSGFKIKIAPVHSDFDVAFFPLSLMGLAD